jgi:hypothetical protein
MKKITLILLFCSILILPKNTFAQDCGGSYYLTSNAGWSRSDWIKIIDIDAANLTDASLPKFTTSDGSKNALEPGPENVCTEAGPMDFASGVFKTPIMTSDDGEIYVPTSVSWPVIYHMAAFAPTMYTSAYSKVWLYGSTPSGSGLTVACTLNDNSIKQSPIYNKPGFIELSRLPAATVAPTVCRHGYIEIDSIPQCERIQWSYSSTAWKRGVKADVNYNDGNGWQPLRWIASNYSPYEASFSEQGYQFEEIFNRQEDPSSYISFRIRIWDGDSIHYKVNANDLTLQETTYTQKMDPLAMQQTVRVHQIRVYSGIVPEKAPTGIKNTVVEQIGLTIQNKLLTLSEVSIVQIISIDGRRIYNGTTDQIDISNISKGIYIIKATSSSGKSLTKKITL